jgi:hypothetical protein
MSALPKEVRKKIRQAEKAHATVYGTGETPAEEITPSETTTSEESTTEKVTKDAANESASESGTESKTEEVPGEKSSEVASEDKWEHKYNVLNGKYRAEVPRLQTQVKELGNHVSSLQGLISTLEKAKPVEAETSPLTATRLLKDDEIVDYGEDMISVVKRAAREEIAPELDRLTAENVELKKMVGRVNETTETTARQAVYTTLDIEVPDWRKLNSDEGFIAWLDTLDAYTNKMRRDLLNEALEANDAARVIVFFEGYLKENATVSTPAEETPTEKPRKASVDMASLAAPGKPRSGGTASTQEGKQTWRQAEISAFYADVRKGAFKNNPEEKVKIEQSIMNAVKHNQIVA